MIKVVRLKTTRKQNNDVYPRINMVIDMAKKHVPNITRYLDLGCGNGYYTLLIGGELNAQEVYGIDINEVNLKKASSLGIKVFKVDLNSDKLPFPDNYFDLVTALEVIEHLVNPDNMLGEVYRVLRSNGVFILSTPNLASWLNRILLLLGFQPTYAEVSTEVSVGHVFKSKGRPCGHLRLFTLRALVELLEYHRFKIVEVRGCGSLHQPRIIKFFDKVFSKIPSLSRILVVASTKY